MPQGGTCTTCAVGVLFRITLLTKNFKNFKVVVLLDGENRLQGKYVHQSLAMNVSLLSVYKLYQGLIILKAQFSFVLSAQNTACSHL